MGIHLTMPIRGERAAASVIAVSVCVGGAGNTRRDAVPADRLRVALTCQNPECRAAFERTPSQAHATSPTCSRRCWQAYVYLRARTRKILRERGRPPKRRRLVPRRLVW